MKKLVSESIWPQYKRHILVTAFAVLFLLIFIPVVTYTYFARDLQTKDSIVSRNDRGIVLYDDKNNPFFTFYQGKNRDYIPLSDIPNSMKHAVITAEDREFYKHPGFSIRGIVRSALSNVKSRELGYGGSTITQQLVKNALLYPQKSFLRKYQEIVLASEIERRYSKDEILEMYLNSVYFGAGSFGIEEASHTYFRKPAKELTLAESALLAGILPAPSQLSPLSGNLDDTIAKQHLVLQEMLNQKYITRVERDEALKQKLVFNTEGGGNELAPHFAIMVRDELIKEYGEETLARSGFKVKTTLNSEWQKIAEQTVKDQVEKLKGNIVSNGATVVEDPKTGAIKALVGSKDWFDDKFGKVNIALSLRQPGSSFKPIVYSAALEQRTITPATLLTDDPTTFPGGYKPVDYDRKYRGKVTPRRALSNSLNIPAVDVINRLGVSNAIEAAKEFGITTIDNDLSRYGLSLVLGAAEVKLLEHTAVYATLANGGVRNEPYLISEVINKSNEVIQRHTPNQKEVISPETAFIISSILSDNATRAEAFGNTLNISRQAAVKTGTTDDYKDAWTMGYTPNLTIGVWVGNNDGTPMDRVAGSLGAAPIWRILMERFLAETPIERFTPPNGVTRTTVCATRMSPDGKTATTSAITEYFFGGEKIPTTCPTISPSASPSGSPTPTPHPTSSSPTATPNPTNNPTPTNSPTPTTSNTPTPLITITITPTPHTGTRIQPQRINNKKDRAVARM